MTSSRWQAHGNVYLVSEDEEYTMDPDLDGVLQVLYQLRRRSSRQPREGGDLHRQWHRRRGSGRRPPSQSPSAGPAIPVLEQQLHDRRIPVPSRS